MNQATLKKLEKLIDDVRVVDKSINDLCENHSVELEKLLKPLSKEKARIENAYRKLDVKLVALTKQQEDIIDKTETALDKSLLKLKKQKEKLVDKVTTFAFDHQIQVELPDGTVVSTESDGWESSSSWESSSC